MSGNSVSMKQGVTVGTPGTSYFIRARLDDGPLFWSSRLRFW